MDFKMRFGGVRGATDGPNTKSTLFLEDIFNT